MNNFAIIYQQIADILSFEVSNSKLETNLSHPSFDWDYIVKEGSKHLVLPALYCRLKAKKLLHTLPEELNNYLEEITSINRNRNVLILKQVQAISKLLNKNNIEHVFLKGSALLALGCFEDNAERMLGDIDILVMNNQLDEAYKLFENHGYIPEEQPLGHKFFEHHHLPRLKTTHHISAVEIHRKLFVSYVYNPLNPESIFKHKRLQNHIWIPAQKHLLMHNILSFQINDKGALYNSINFRSAYDTIIIQQDYTGTRDWYKIKVFRNNFQHSSLFFMDIKKATDVKTNIFTYFYIFKLKHITFYKTWNKLIGLVRFTPIIFNRIWIFMSNKAYRKAIIRDRYRIYAHFKSILNNF